MTCDAATSRPPAKSVCRLMIVDDDQDAVKLLSVALNGLGHKIETARNGTEALTVANSFRPHMVIMDIGLPGLDGYYVARQLRMSIENVLLIAVTGRHTVDDFSRSHEAGFDYHLVKPVDLKQLTALLNHWESQGGCESAPDAA